MSVSLGSFLMALVTLFARLIEFLKTRNVKKENNENQSLRSRRGDLEKFLVAIKIRRKIRNDKSHSGNIVDNIVTGTDGTANELHKPKGKYQR